MMNKLRTYALQAFLIMTPLCFFPTFTRESQEHFFQYACIFVVAAFVGNIWLGAFLAWNVILFVYNGAVVGWEQVINILFGCLLFAFSRYFFKSNRFETVNKPILIVVCVSLIFMFLQLLHIDPIFQPQTNAGVQMGGPLGDPIGFFGIKEANGTFLTIALPILASINPILGLLLLIPIKMSQSSGVYLAALISILFYTFYLHKKIFRFIMFLIPIVGVLILLDLRTDPKTFTARFPVWWSAISYTLRPPSYGIGYGPDSYRNYTPRKNFVFVGDNHYNHAIMTKVDKDTSTFAYYSPTRDIAKIEALTRNAVNTNVSKGQVDFWDNPHNEYINMLFQYGIVGIILLGGLIREMYFRFKYAIKDKELIVITSCLLVYLVTSITNFPLELARTGFFFPILLGAFYNRTDSTT